MSAADAFETGRMHPLILYSPRQMGHPFTLAVNNCG